LLVENGAAILKDPRDNDESPVSDEKKATFYAAAELNGEPVPLVIHPVLTKYFLKLEITESTNHDYDLPNEDLTSPAVYPPMVSLKLENCQGYRQTINVDAFNDPRGASVTVQDVLRTIHEGLSVLLSKRELNDLGGKERAALRASFKKRCKTEEERGKGLRGIDYLGGRDRLQILPKHARDGSVLLPSSAPSTPALRSMEYLGESSVAGSSRNP
jgi:hypothetical protein